MKVSIIEAKIALKIVGRECQSEDGNEAWELLEKFIHQVQQEKEKEGKFFR